MVGDRAGVGTRDVYTALLQAGQSYQIFTVSDDIWQMAARGANNKNKCWEIFKWTPSIG